MEKESFEDPSIAEFLNEHFVSIKVDREERPDIDRVYMAFVQATTGSGGWPMSVWLTPELKPFFGGTYFPTVRRGNRPGFLDVLREISQRWTTSAIRLTQSAEIHMERIKVVREGGTLSLGPVPDVKVLSAGVRYFISRFDEQNGGFGRAPKFPRPSELLFLLRESFRSDEPEAKRIAMATLEAMARGGIRDHVGGGFHRYSVDVAWRVPHFEKMLYDQAQLSLAFLEAGQLSGQKSFHDTAEDTLSYVLREMVSSEGGFYSAEDADSSVADGTGKAEGAFYLWTEDEIDQLFGSNSDIVKLRFGVKANGNAPHDSQGEFLGKNILYQDEDTWEIAKLLAKTPTEVRRVIGTAGSELLECRANRDRPALDDKVLTAWNGLMIAALSRAAQLLPESTPSLYGSSAKRAAEFIYERLWDPDRRVLYRRIRNGHASIDGYAEDYAFLVWGLLELFQLESDVLWLDWAQELQARQNELFWDDVDGGWYSTTGEDPSLILRMKDDYDGAEPAAGSVSVSNLLTLGYLTGDRGLISKAERTLIQSGISSEEGARVAPMMMASLVQYHAGPTQIVILGKRSDESYQALRRELSKHYLPFTVRVHVEPGDNQYELSKRLPFIESMSLVDGSSAAYVCSNFTCLEPVTTSESFGIALEAL